MAAARDPLRLGADVVTEYASPHVQRAGHDPAARRRISQLEHAKRLSQTLFARGFLDGTFSDITISALGMDFRLHRIVLLSNPYFASMLGGGPWREQDTQRIAIRFDDPNITVESLTIVLSRIYGQPAMSITARNAKALLAAGLFFDDTELCDESLRFMVANISPATACEYLAFCDEFDYGVHTQTLVNAVVTRICRSGVDAFAPVLEALPLAWLARIVGSDLFYCPSEFARYELVRNVLAARRRSMLLAASLADISISTDSTAVSQDRNVATPPDHIDKDPSAPSGHRRTACVASDETLVSDSDSDVFDDLADDAEDCSASHAALISNAVNFSHMSFSQLKAIMSEGHVPRRTLRRAVWNQRELEDIVTDASVDQLELNIASAESRRRAPHNDTDHIDGQMLASMLDGPVFPHRGARFPPFRFSVEFDNLRDLQTGVKLVSPAAHYAGSAWQVYLQQVVADGVPKLGVYLQRVPVAAVGWLSVDDASEHGDGDASDLDAGGALNAPAQRGAGMAGRSMHAPLTPRSPASAAGKPGAWSIEDTRVQIRTWFQLVCFFAERCYVLESKPDNFRLHQSWGWRSHKLFKDASECGDGKLRCSVVLGYV